MNAQRREILDHYNVPVCACGHAQDMHDGNEGEDACLIWPSRNVAGRCTCNQFRAAYREESDK